MSSHKGPTDRLLGSDSDGRVRFLRLQAIVATLVLGLLGLFNLIIGYRLAALLDLVALLSAIAVYLLARRFGMTTMVRAGLALSYGFLVLSSVLLDGTGGIFWVAVFIVLSFFLMGKALATATACSLIAIAAATAAPTDPYHVLLFTMSSAFLTLFLYFFSRHSETLEFTWRDNLRADPLTRALNRRALDDDLVQVLRDGRGPAPVLLMVDVDNFKSVNDSLGHVSGDLCLARIAERIAESLRGAPAMFYRYGGDEFAILYSGPLTLGQDLAERIRAGVEAGSILGDHAMTVSIGIAALRRGDTLPRALDRADRALYEAKSSGRNRIGTA